MQTVRPMCVARLGTVPYARAQALQMARHAQVAEGQCDDTLLVLEHPPVITTGRRAGRQHLKATPEHLVERGIEVFETSRGGDVTYHGPGQLVGYPIIALQPHEQDLKGYVTALEEILICTAADFGVEAVRVTGLRGIWVGNDKLAAIGIRIARWTTSHGFALNVHTDLTVFDLMVPCGLHGRGVTSLARLCRRVPSMSEVEATVVAHTARIFGRKPYAAPEALWANLTPEVVCTLPASPEAFRSKDTVS